MDIWELKKTAVDPDLNSIDESFLKNKVILLFVELKEEDNKNCDPNSCDDKGINVTVAFLPIAVDVEDAKLLLGTTGAGFGVNTYTALPEMRMKRWDAPNTSPVSSEDIFKSYRNILDKNFIDKTEATLSSVYTVFGSLVASSYPTNPFTGLSARFNFLYNGSISINQLIHLQYYYDLFSDLLQAYQEFRKAGTHVLSTCCPDSGLFPRHLLLGEAIPSVTSGLLPYRHYFIYSPLFDQQNMMGELISLFKRLVLLTEQFFLPTIQGANTKEDEFLRITPSLLWDAPLSHKAIPYYYQVNSGSNPLYLSWHYRRTLLNDATRNLSYHAKQYNSSDDFVNNPLHYDLEPYNFLRIEGVVGKPYVHVLSQVKSKIQNNRLPIDIIALSTETAGKLTAQLSSINRQDAVNSMEMICHFQDLESMYDSMRKEILCMLCKELKYYYDFTFSFLNNFLKKNIDAGEISQVSLFDVCSRGYALKNNSLGMMIEFLYRKGFTDETLTLENFFVTFGINLQDANNDDIPDMFTGQVLTIYLTLLNFFKIPLGIIRLSTLLTEDLTEFDAKAYCDATDKLAEYAKSIKSLFTIFTGAREKEETTTPNTGAAATGVVRNEAMLSSNINRINISSQSSAMVSAVAGSGNVMLRLLAAILMIEDFFDHLDVLIYNCKCSALLSLKRDYMRRYAMLTRLRQFGYFSKMHPGLQHKAGVPMGGTFIIVYHANARGRTLAVNNLNIRNENIAMAFDDRSNRINAFASAVGSSRQSAIAAGFVFDEAQKPIAGATVMVKETNESTVTNANGRFVLSTSVVPYTLIIEFLGYDDVTLQKFTGDDGIMVQMVPSAPNMVQELQPGIVIADFYLPYRCCSDCPPITYVVNETVPPPPPPNKGPVANAGPDKEITLPKSNEQLDGTASTDLDGTITFYQWAKLSGPASFNIATPNSAVTGVNDLEEGLYVFELTVTDNSGSIARDTMQLKVNAAPPPENKPPIADAGLDSSIPLSFVSVTMALLDGSNSKDEDGAIVSQQWTKISGPPATISSPNLLKTQVSLFEEGIYIFQLLVKDNGGLTDADEVAITVTRANRPPIANAGPSVAIVVSPNNPSFVLDGSQSKDPEGGLLTYQWKFEGGISTPVINDPNAEKTTVSNVVAGEYKFSLLVTDDKGANDVASVSITVRITDDVVVKRCSPAPELVAVFNKFGTNVPDIQFEKFREAFQQFGDLQEFFKMLSIVQDESTDKLIDFYGSNDVNKRMVKWLSQLSQDIITNPDRKDLRLLALQLYRLLVRLAMHIVCIQSEDVDVAKIPMNRVFAVIGSNAKQWVEASANLGYTPEELKVMSAIRSDMSKERDTTVGNGEETSKEKYLKLLLEIVNMIKNIA
jgi:hypothetical protein